MGACQTQGEEHMITQIDVLKNFDYKNGNLYWKSVKKGIVYGQLAGDVKKNGYRYIVLNKKRYLAHRLIFLFHYGYLPEFIDHIDNNKTNNQIENLRQATKNQNAQNKKMSKTNKSGVKGVSWHNKANKWQSEVVVNGQWFYCGLHKTIESATKSVQLKRTQLSQEFANHG
jgi:hypothetical protein